MGISVQTYALCKSFTKKAIDEVLAGNTDLNNYYTKAQVDKLFGDNTGNEIVSALPSGSDAKPGRIYFLQDVNNPNKLTPYVYNKGQGWVKVADNFDIGEKLAEITDTVQVVGDSDKFVIISQDGKPKVITYDKLANSLLDTIMADPKYSVEYTIDYNVDDHQIVLTSSYTPTKQEITIPIVQGATEQEDGKAGLVPAPAIGDRDKFLRGDGTYAEAEGSVDAITVDALEAMFA